MVGHADGFGRGFIRLPTISLCLAEGLEESHGDEASRIGHRRIAGLVPIRIVLAANNVKEVAFLKG
jgi:hypothetical protein